MAPSFTRKACSIGFVLAFSVALVAQTRPPAVAPTARDLPATLRRPWGYMITCSSDSGANWTAASYRTGGTVDFPRITSL